jgi:hypothetical protein
MRNKVWYKKFTEGAWTQAHYIAGIEQVAAPSRRESNPDGAMVQAQEDAFVDAECARIGA